MTISQPLLYDVPPGLEDLYAELAAPPRLVAHLRLVHDVAGRLLAGFAEVWPELTVDAEAARYEPAGELLLELGFPQADERLAYQAAHPLVG
ncbi:MULTISPECIES: hypothetical protein [unclassified Kitasatospora]|uniref:hypothetical protein n=1 Tax=unclassified Kitasatospora TaxID=2633591 RepID=UPI000710D640|nr:MULTISPECIES: hypothetical protein [unclassified Kitasatospora]KQV22861.1 hypothetical protein ASC99_17085 [Kitasatospora sp. Root107]KRB61721.1 hypothetical protein ASE03_08875 [Kitasatospora sp. Root187]